MKLTLKRTTFTDKSTIGELSIDGTFFCYTLEDIVRNGPKVMHETAIPYGTYEVVVNMSNRFKRLMPLLLGVPNFEGIRIHSGNTAAHTSGCILVGMQKGVDTITQSTIAYDSLFTKIKGATQRGEAVRITIE